MLRLVVIELDLFFWDEGGTAACLAEDDEATVGSAETVKGLVAD